MEASLSSESATLLLPAVFGHGMLRNFSFDPRYLNFNHGKLYLTVCMRPKFMFAQGLLARCQTMS